MKKARIILLMLLGTVLVQISCKKEETPPADTYKQPTSKAEVVAIPSGLQAKASSNEIGAGMAVSFIGMANAFSSMNAYFVVPTNAAVESKKGGSKTYSWSNSGFSYWVTYTELADKYVWKCEYEFPDVPRFTFIEAEEAKTGKSGNWTVYSAETVSEEVWSYDWTIDLVNTYSADLIFNDSGSQIVFAVTSKADHSGSFYYTDGLELVAEIIWNANGSGTYTFFGGMESYSGNWTAK